MSIDLRIEVKPNYVHLHCRGAFSSNALLEVWGRAFRIATDKRCKAVLVDLRDLEGQHSLRSSAMTRGYALPRPNDDLVLAS